MIAMITSQNPEIRYIYYQTFLLFDFDEINKYSRKITEIGGGIRTEMIISQQPKAIESRNLCQMIALTIFYNLIIRYINKLTFLLLKYLRKLKI